MKSPLHKTLAAGVLACVLAGCSSDGGGDWLTMLKAARSAWDNRDAPVSLDEASDVPFATLGVRIDGGREQMLILATDLDGERLWTSGARLAITTRNGRIVRTAGFGSDLSGYSNASSGPPDWARRHRTGWSADFADLGFYSVQIDCEMAPAGRDPITILGKEFDTIRIDETCHSEKLDWSFTNSYWVNPESGRVWRSLQHIHPRGMTLEIEILRPPLSPG